MIECLSNNCYIDDSNCVTIDQNYNGEESGYCCECVTDTPYFCDYCLMNFVNPDMLKADIDIGENFPNGSWTITLYHGNMEYLKVKARITYHGYNREEALIAFNSEHFTAVDL
tara:strand:+ start:15 stop:353 length:339 start_codon:yes stop_codon:yes gene_type:complete